MVQVVGRSKRYRSSVASIATIVSVAEVTGTVCAMLKRSLNFDLNGDRLGPVLTWRCRN